MTETLSFRRRPGSSAAATWAARCSTAGAWRASTYRRSQSSGRAARRSRACGSSPPADAGPPPRSRCSRSSRRSSTRSRRAAPAAERRTVVVSMLAGVESASLRQRFPGAGRSSARCRTCRSPIRRGVTGLYSADADEAARQRARQPFAALGFAMWMADEAKLAALGRWPARGRPMSRASSPRWPRPASGAASSEEIAADHRARDGARHRLDGGDHRRGHGSRSRAGSRARRGRPRPVLPCSIARTCSTLIAATIDAAFARGARACRRSARPALRLPRQRACPRRVAAP